MASVLTDQVLRAKQLAVMTGFSATPKVVQLTSGQGSTGNAVISVPGTNRVTGNPFRVRVQGSSVRTASETLILTLLLDGVSLGTFTAVAASGTSSFSAAWDVLFESATINLCGQITGWGSAAIVASTALATGVLSDLTAEGHLLTVSVSSGATDATGTVTVSEFSLEVL